MLSARLKRIFPAVLTGVLCVLLVGCGERVEFEEKKVSSERTELALVLQEGETAKLDALPALERVDLSGSECYGEIAEWAAAHPQVDVTFTVAFPDGTVVDNHAESLAPGALDAPGAERTAELVAYLPALKTIDLTACGVTPQAAHAIAASAPNAEIIYTCTLLGHELSLDAESVDLTGITAAQADEVMSVLPYLANLRRVTLGDEAATPLDWSVISAMVQACPDADFDYAFTLYGKPLTLLDKTVDINHITIDDGGALVYSIASSMKNLEYLDMDFCGLSNEQMLALRDALPGVKVVWRVWFGSNYSVRTDVEKILASKPSVGGLVTDRDVTALSCCTDVKYIDLGHNEVITDISFVACMPKLEVAILAMNNISDISPLANCTELEYLEIQTNAGISDLSPLAACTKLEHLNIGNCRNFNDITPLMGLDKLKRLWLGCSAPVPAEQVEAFIAAHPDCEVNTTVWSDPTSEGWRIDHVDPWTNQVYLDERYELLVEQFGYNEGDYSFISRDPLYFAHG